MFLRGKRSNNMSPGTQPGWWFEEDVDAIEQAMLRLRAVGGEIWFEKILRRRRWSRDEDKRMGGCWLLPRREDIGCGCVRIRKSVAENSSRGGISTEQPRSQSNDPKFKRKPPSVPGSGYLRSRRINATKTGQNCSVDEDEIQRVGGLTLMVLLAD